MCCPPCLAPHAAVVRQLEPAQQIKVEAAAGTGIGRGDAYILENGMGGRLNIAVAGLRRNEAELLVEGSEWRTLFLV